MPAASPFVLLKTRRLWPLALAQACGAFNDNLVKNALVVLALFKLGEGGAGLSALAGALFIAPYILLSATAGQLADRFPKPRLVLVAKLAEVGLMGAAAAGFATGSIPGLLAVLFGLGVQSAMFGPLKYGLLPEQLRGEELVAGNGVIEASTFLAILAGTVAGGALILLEDGATLVSAVGLGAALVGVAAALRVLPAPPADPALRINANILAETWRTVRQAASIRPVWLAILGLSWFWTVGALLLTEFPLLARDTLGADGHVVTLFLTVFAVGVGAGSLVSSVLLEGEVSPRHVPFAALGMSVFLWDFAAACTAAEGIASVSDVLGSLAGWRILVDLALLSACGGIFSVPLYAILQDGAPETGRARMIAANNVVNAVFMVAGAGVAAGLAALGLAPATVLMAAAVANLAVAFWIIRLLPQQVLRALFRFYFETFHGVRVKGLDHYRAAGDRVVIVANHLSFADACLIACYLPESPTFAIDTRMAQAWWVRPFLAAVETFKVDVQSPFAIRPMMEAVRDGRKLMIFPEGRLTKTGSLMKVYEGAGVVADKADATILPISIEGLQFTRLGRMRGKLPMRWFPRLSLTIMPPVRLDPPRLEGQTPRRRREAIGRALQDLMVETVFQARNTDRTLFAALLDARALHGGRTLIAEDINRAPVSYDRVVLGAAALGRQIARRMTGEAATVGLMLPNANATLVAFMGLQAFGLVPAMLNFSAGADGMLAACRAAKLRHIVSSRAFVEKGKLGAVVARMEQQVEFLWLEDIRAGIGLRDKLRAQWDAAFARRLPGARAAADAWAVVLFTSGSEGTPKGVVHSHRSLLANCAQLASVIDFTAADRVFNAMPVFHSFGLQGGTLLPLLHGVRTFHYPSPLHYRVVPALIYDTDATIAFGTDTFLNGWARHAHAYDFYAMRMIFGGAEKIREETRRLFADRFGVRLLEGYGATETAPALAINTPMNNRPGTVGRFLPGIRHRLERVPGVEGAGRLHVSGPNVMLGYLLPSAPGVLVPSGGDYDTGDIVAVDAQGFVEIRGRAKRFAKIAGEMVSMTAAESLVATLWPEAQHAVVSLPDARKGEALLLVTTRPDAAVRDILAEARARGVPELMVPRAVLPVAAMPLLGTGKIDYPAVQRLAAASQAVAA